MSSYNIKKIENFNQWDVFVDASNGGTRFHKSDWLFTCAISFNTDMKIIGCFRDEELVGGCAFFSKRIKGIFKLITSNCPMMPYGGFIVANNSSSTKIKKKESIEREILTNLINQIKKEHFDVAIFTMAPPFQDIRPFIWDMWESKVKYTYMIELSSDFDKQITKEVRWSIKKALELGLIVNKEWNIEKYCQLFEGIYKRQNKEPPVSKSALIKLLKLLETTNTGEMWLCKSKDGLIVAAEIIILDLNIVYRWSAASDTEYRSTGATSYLLYEVIKHYHKRGFKSINLMGANTPNIAKFISSYNPTLEPYYTVEYFSHFGRFAYHAKKIIEIGKASKTNEKK